MTTGEDAHGCDYFTQVFLSPELCNSTNWVKFFSVAASPPGAARPRETMQPTPAAPWAAFIALPATQRARVLDY